MDNSVAIWADTPPADSDLHINYWIIKRRFLIREHFLDFGIKLKDWNGGRVCIYIPIKKIDNCISEIGQELKDRELANALFNENCRIHLSDAKRFEIELPAEKLDVFIFDKENDVESEQRYEGTLFSINIFNERKNWYVRLRIRIGPSEAFTNFKNERKWRTIRSTFSKKHTPIGSFYQSVRSSVDAVDFRINIKRSLNYSLLDENQNNLLKIKKLHFFIIYDNDEDFSYSTTRPKKARLLENRVWSKYLQDISGKTSNYCATHWACSNSEAEGWDVFLKIRYASANVLTILLYLLLIGGVAFIINIVAALIYEKYNVIKYFGGESAVQDNGSISDADSSNQIHE